MWITKVSIRHPVFATMVMVGLMVLGLFSYRSLGVESMPNVELPFAWVETQYPGASPEQVENDVTRPMEEVINTVSGIKNIRSNSWEGRSGVSIEFHIATNMDKAMQDLRDKVARVRPGFPKEVKEPFVIRADGENQQRQQRAQLFAAQLLADAHAVLRADHAGDHQDRRKDDID